MSHRAMGVGHPCSQTKGAFYSSLLLLNTPDRQTYICVLLKWTILSFGFIWLKLLSLYDLNCWSDLLNLQKINVTFIFCVIENDHILMKLAPYFFPSPFLWSISIKSLKFRSLTCLILQWQKLIWPLRTNPDWLNSQARVTEWQKLSTAWLSWKQRHVLFIKSRDDHQCTSLSH